MSDRYRLPERCMCGDPECGACFPYSPPEQDGDAEYDRLRQQEVDDARTVERAQPGQSEAK